MERFGSELDNEEEGADKDNEKGDHALVVRANADEPPKTSELTVSHSAFIYSATAESMMKNILVSTEKVAASDSSTETAHSNKFKATYRVEYGNALFCEGSRSRFFV